MAVAVLAVIVGPHRSPLPITITASEGKGLSEQMVLEAAKSKSITPVLASLLLRASAQLMVESRGETGV